jgi:hypothetical protein
MPHQRHPPAGWYRVVVVLNGFVTNVQHNLGGRRAFELAEEARARGLDAFWVRQAGKHPFTCANTCPQCTAGLQNWRRGPQGIVDKPRVE